MHCRLIVCLVYNMMTSWREHAFCITGPLWGNPLVTNGFPSQRPVIQNFYFLHARPRIPGDEIAIFTAVIHWWRSPLHQFARARTIDEYDVTMLVSYIRVTSQINCGDVTILNQKRLSLATTAKSAIDNCFGGIECWGHQIAYTK